MCVCVSLVQIVTRVPAQQHFLQEAKTHVRGRPERVHCRQMPGPDRPVRSDHWQILAPVQSLALSAMESMIVHHSLDHLILFLFNYHSFNLLF